MRRPNVGRSAASEIISIVLLVLGVLILNLVSGFYSNGIFLDIVKFFNVNLIFLIVISLVFFVGDLFAIFGFPVNLPAPFFRAVASTLLTVFIFRIFRLLESVVNAEIFNLVYWLAPAIYALVFFLVLIFGYIHIFTALTVRKAQRIKKSVKKDEIKKAVVEEKIEEDPEEIRKEVSELVEKFKKKTKKKTKKAKKKVKKKKKS